MDVDITETTEIDTTCTNQRKTNACFYCQKPGHFAKDCRKKKSDRVQVESSRGNQHDSNVKTADLINFSTMTDNQQTSALADYMQSNAFIEKDNDFKLNFIVKVTPKAF